MSENKKDGKSSGGGALEVGAAVLVGAGAAALGFMARDLWNNYQEYQAESSGSNEPKPPPRSPRSTSDWEHKTDKNLGTRRKHRDEVHDQNVPDEMKCVVCLSNPREVCLVPCGHVCLCEDCAEKIDTKCPVCQQHYENKKAIYM